MNLLVNTMTSVVKELASYLCLTPSQPAAVRGTASPDLLFRI